VTRGGLCEKDLTLDLALRLKGLLQQRTDVRVVLTRSADRDLGLWDRRDLSNDNRADLFVSLHFNGSNNGAVNRTEVFYSSRVSRQSAQVFRDMVESAVGSDSGLLQRVHWTVLWENRARLGAILLEIMYLSHPAADHLLAKTENLDLLARALQQAVDSVLDAETRRRAL
jgi:N-acetylmuramoyl-L-alanine amidase